MYFREIESNKQVAAQNSDTLKKNAADRLRANQEYNRRNKRPVKNREV